MQTDWHCDRAGVFAKHGSVASLKFGRVLKKLPLWQEAVKWSTNSSVEKLIGSLHWTPVKRAVSVKRQKWIILVFCDCAYFLNCGINISWMIDTLIMRHQWEAANYAWVDNRGLSFMRCSLLTQNKMLSVCTTLKLLSLTVCSTSSSSFFCDDLFLFSDAPEGNINQLKHMLSIRLYNIFVSNLIFGMWVGGNMNQSLPSV